MFKKEQNDALSGKMLEARSSDALFYKILEYLNGDTQKLVDWIDKSVDECGKELFSKKPERTIEKISITRKNVILLNTILKPQMILFNKLQSGVIKGFADNMEDYWGNIMDAYQRAWDIIEDDRELINGFSKTFDSLQVNKTNEVMKILTLVTSILLPLTFVASLYGMYVKLPMEGHPAIFMIVATVMVGIAILMVIYFRLKKWM